MSERIGIGVLCYGNAGEIARNVASVRDHCRLDYGKVVLTCVVY